MDAAQRAAMGQSAKEYYLAHYRRSELLRKLEHFILEAAFDAKPAVPLM